MGKGERNEKKRHVGLQVANNTPRLDRGEGHSSGMSDDLLVALGANQAGGAGPPRAALEAALAALDAAGLRVAARRRFYRSPAFPAGAGPDFVNAVARIEGGQDPAAALRVLHRVEAALGRTRARRWEPRVCDLDLLAAGAAVIPDMQTVRRWMALPPEAQRDSAPDRLILPHPRLHERAFVLLPLLEVAPDWRHPLLGLDARAMRDALPAEALAGVEPL
jgi:2-amino-4-hydroxy-6-hydroxymethyldihydropteridine diphosphokinase